MSIASIVSNPAKGLPRSSGWLLMVVAAAAYYPRFIKTPAGMELYPQAAACLWHGQILQGCALGFTYPPFFAFIMLPFAAMPLWLRELVWYVVTLAAVTGSFKLAEFLARKGIGAPLNTTMVWSLRTLALLFSAKAILAVFENQAYDALVILFILLGLAALVTGRDVGGGVSLALAAALKTTPLIFLPYLLYKRYFAAAGAFVLVYLIMSCLPDVIFAPTGAAHSYFITWLQEIAGPSLGLDPTKAKLSFWHGANILNHSLRGAVALKIDETSQHTLFDASLGVTDAAFIIVVSVLIALSPRRPQSIALDGSLLVIAMLMLSPMTSRSHYVALLLPYMTLLAANLHDQRTANLGRFILMTSFVLVTLSGNDLVGQTVTVWAYEHSTMVLGVLVLLLYLTPLVVERHQQRTIPYGFGQSHYARLT